MAEEESAKSLARAILIVTAMDIILCKADFDLKKIKLWEQIIKGTRNCDYKASGALSVTGKVKNKKRAPENVSAYLVYKLSNFGDKEQKKQAKWRKNIFKGYNFASLRRNVELDPLGTFEEIKGTNLSKEDMRNLVGKEIKYDRIERQIKSGWEEWRGCDDS